MNRGAGAARSQRAEHLSGLSRTPGFEHRYNSVKRFVRTLRAREPQRFDVLEFLPGEEAQVDYGQGALTRTANGTYRRPYLFVMTLKYSGKSFRKVSWKTDQQIWAHLHEQAWRSFGGSTQYVVLDNLREGVITPDLYEPKLNPVYAAMLAHYGVVADVCRVGDPDRKGTVERAIQYTQDTALKGRRFELPSGMTPRRSRYAPMDERRIAHWLVTYDAFRSVVAIKQLAIGADLHAEMRHAIKEHQADGWTIENDGAYGFFFCHRTGERREVRMQPTDPSEPVPLSNMSARGTPCA